MSSFNPFDILKNADAIKSQMGKLQESMRSVTATGCAGGELVKVTMNGQCEVLAVELDPIAVDPRDIRMLQDLIVAAAHDARTRIEEALRDKLDPAVAGFSGFNA